MAATYPSDQMIASWASANGADPDQVYTYAAAHDALPSSLNALGSFILSLDQNTVWPANAPQSDIDAFVQQHLGPAANQQAAVQWFQSQALMDSSGNWTSTTLPAGYFYDQATGAGASSGSGNAAAVVPASPSPLAMLGGLGPAISAHPILFAGGALILVGGVYLLLRKR